MPLLGGTSSIDHADMERLLDAVGGLGLALPGQVAAIEFHVDQSADGAGLSEIASMLSGGRSSD